MPTLVLDPAPAQLEELLEQRRKWGADRHDEVWEGVYHMVPPAGAPHAFLAQQLSVLLNAPARAADLYVSFEFGLGVKDDYRVPDLGVHRELHTGTWIPTVAIAVEILSPADKTWEKLSFYAAHGVDELLIVDPRARSVEWFGLSAGEYEPIERSSLLALSPQQLAGQIDWPPVD